VIGHCSGGRQSFLAAGSACRLDAAVDCYGGASSSRPAPEGQPAARLTGPGGADRGTCPCPAGSACSARTTSTPRPSTFAELEKRASRANGKTYEFHSLRRGAGHAFMQVDRPSYRPEAAVDAWQRIWDFFRARYPVTAPAL